MLRKAFIPIAPIAVVAALALMPASASADLQCPRGVTNTQYCAKVCVVPQLRGQNIFIGYLLLLLHNCSLGAVTASGQRTVPYLTIVSTNPPAGSVRPAGYPVSVALRLTAAKDERMHTGKPTQKGKHSKKKGKHKPAKHAHRKK